MTSHVVASMTSSWVLVMSGRTAIEDPQSQVLSGVEVPEVLRVLDHMTVPRCCDLSDAATCVRPANENVQERFDYKLMNEPYLLRRQPRKGKKRQRTGRGTGKKKPQRRKEGEMSSRDEKTCLVILHAGSRLFTQ